MIRRSFRLKLHREVRFVGGDGTLRCAGWGSLFQSRLSLQPQQVLLTCLPLGRVSSERLEPEFQLPPCSRAGPVPPGEAPVGHKVPQVTGSRSRDLYLLLVAAGSHPSGCKQTWIPPCWLLPAPTQFLWFLDAGAKGISLAPFPSSAQQILSF